MRLKVTPQDVRDKAMQIETLRGNLFDTMTSMRSKVESLSGQNSAWDSESGRAFTERHLEVHSNCTRALERIQTHVENLRMAADTYSTLEEGRQAEVRGLDTGYRIP
jgi:WXG100 family type VII secretion target